MSRTLALDIGGTGLKASVLDAKGKMLVNRVRIDTPHPCPPRVLLAALVDLVRPLPAFDRIAVGFPGVVKGGTVLTAPNLGTAAWQGFNLAGALRQGLGRPVRIINDAEMQGMAAVSGKGLEMVMTLGTGIGTAIFRDGVLMPHLELAHHPVHKDLTYDEYIGDAARKKIGKVKWNRRVQRVLGIVDRLLLYDRLYLGGGNSRLITFTLGPRVRLIPNEDGLLGGFELWQDK